ncbi:MAG: FAD-binding oxidoreductase [Rhodobacteraceae bacterium]|jgi:FAD/FMN-containing dehydrogenase|nr:FAD-binding oxidoreductase [Paracoccaceae bacterium]
MLNPADEIFIAKLREGLPEAAFREASDAYLTEPRGKYRGKGVVIAPASTDEVAFVVKACAEARVGIVPHSGGTGLVGGQVMPEGPTPVVLSLARMNRIRGTYPAENALVAEAGVILADVQSAAASIGRLFPLSLASEGSARIGGLLATNAGGVNVLRYGNARAQCLGLEVVLADGTIWNGLTRLRKDNTGYDLRDLMIGSEGSLGIITAATLILAPRPRSVATALLSVGSPDDALKLLTLAQERLGQTISAFELLNRMGFDFMAETGVGAPCPIAGGPDWMVLAEIGLSSETGAEEAMMGLFEAALEAGLAHDGVIASSEAQRAALWKMREEIPEANRRIGAVSSHDTSVPLSAIPDFIARARAAIEAIGPYRINCFGHLGDGNLHYNVFPPKGETKAAHAPRQREIQTAVHDIVHALGGSFSAEHGIGRLKVEDLERYGDPAKLAAMRAIKQALDPKGILNPGAVLRSSRA